jgi:hypothetical protein
MTYRHSDNPYGFYLLHATTATATTANLTYGSLQQALLDLLQSGALVHTGPAVAKREPNEPLVRDEDAAYLDEWFEKDTV